MGDKTDNSLKIIKKYNNKISYWVSQKDKGIYDAFNKGMLLAKGKYIGILNSDDKYTKRALEIIKKYIIKFPKKDFIFGSVKKHWGVLHGYNPKNNLLMGFLYQSFDWIFSSKDRQLKFWDYIILNINTMQIMSFYRMIVLKKMNGVATKKKK